MRFAYHDVKRTHEDNPDCPMRLISDLTGHLICLDCGRTIMMTGVELVEKNELPASLKVCTCDSQPVGRIHLPDCPYYWKEDEHGPK